MPIILATLPFDETKLPLVQDFKCGDDTWAKHSAEWIKSNAIKSIRRFRTNRVWLYLDTQQNVVGFGSLGETTWPWPLPDGPRTSLAYIPQMAVHSDFQKQPVGVGETKYCKQILRDLIAKAMLLGPDKLVLHVHPDNPAIGEVLSIVVFCPRRIRRRLAVDRR
jgi:ribosomal protein S18 acetylase RimI-like enzyme